MPTHTLTVKKPGRLDKVVAVLLREVLGEGMGEGAGVSRSAIQHLIERGQVTLNGQVRAASHQVKPSDILVVNMPEQNSAITLPEAIPLNILYEDDDVIAVDKPAGMVVHPGAGNPAGTLANAILAHAPGIANVGDRQRPGIVHRLDKQTSGIVLLAKNESAYRALQGQFKSRVIKKLYIALCVGNVQPPRGIIQKPIGRDPAHRQRMAIVVGGRESLTQYAVAEVFELDAPRCLALSGIEDIQIPKGSVYTCLRAQPATGRTHQIRVHLASIGFPVVGDGLYGATRRDPLSRAIAPRHLLHASELTFVLPSSGQAISLFAPLPADMRRVIDGLGE